MNRSGEGHWAFLRMLSGGIAVQAIMSASNFAVGLLLIRRTTEVQYGYYVLVTTAVLLATTLQNSFIQPPMVVRLTRSDDAQRSSLIGGLYKEQAQLILVLAVLAVGIILLIGTRGPLSRELLWTSLGGTAAVIAALRREFFRMVLFGYRRPQQVLRADVVYCVLLITGAFIATSLPLPAAAATLSLALSAIVGGLVLSRSLWRYAPWKLAAPRGALRSIAADGTWSAFGGGVHWLFTQGYSYLVAATLSVRAVSALAATKLLTAPVGLLSIGIGTLMLPTVSRWTHDLKAVAVLRRLLLFALALDAIACLFFAGVWVTRGWIFGHILKKHFEQGDAMLLVWFAVTLVSVFRDQLLFFLVTRSRFKLTSTLTLASAILSLTLSYVLVHHIGTVGASLGLLIGEFANTVGILVLSVLEARRAPLPIGTAQVAQ